MRLLTFSSTHDDPRAALLRRSCRAFNADLEWIECMHTKEKPERLIKKLSTVNADEIVCCVDGFDVLCANFLEGFEERFHRVRRDVIFGAERFCFHHFASTRIFFESLDAEHPYRYLNGGMFAGRSAALLELMREVSSWDQGQLEGEFRGTARACDNFNDQTLFGLYAMKYPKLVALDHRADFFLNLWGDYDRWRELLHVDGHLIHQTPLTNPFFVHVSQIDRFYAVYLSIAHLLNVRMQATDVDFTLLNSVQEMFLAGELPAECSVSREIQDWLRQDVTYRNWLRRQKLASVLAEVASLHTRLISVFKRCLRSAKAPFDKVERKRRKM